MQGQTDVDLDETGLAQAAAGRPALAALQPELIISSDLRRASRTAAGAGRADRAAGATSTRGCGSATSGRGRG